MLVGSDPIDPVTKAFYVSSVYRRKILRVGPKGEATEFATERDGLWSVLGMKVDAARRHLWVCTAAQPQMSNYDASERGRSGLFKFDLRTGKLAGKYMLHDDSKQHWLGDLVLDSRGDVYTTDSVSRFISSLSDLCSACKCGMVQSNDAISSVISNSRIDR